MGRIGLPEILVVLVVVLILFGAKKLPEIGQALGKAIKEFKKAGKEVKDDSEGSGTDKEGEQKT